MGYLIVLIEPILIDLRLPLLSFPFQAERHPRPWWRAGRGGGAALRSLPCLLCGSGRVRWGVTVGAFESGVAQAAGRAHKSKPM